MPAPRVLGIIGTTDKIEVFERMVRRSEMVRGRDRDQPW